MPDKRVEWSKERRLLRGDEEERLRERVLLTSKRAEAKRKRDLEMGRIRMRRRRAIEKLEREGLGKETFISKKIPCVRSVGVAP